MSKTMKCGLWILFYLAMCFFAYQVLGWLGVLLIIGGGAIGALALIPINRKARDDERKAQLPGLE